MSLSIKSEILNEENEQNEQLFNQEKKNSLTNTIPVLSLKNPTSIVTSAASKVASTAVSAATKTVSVASNAATKTVSVATSSAVSAANKTVSVASNAASTASNVASSSINSATSAASNAASAISTAATSTVTSVTSSASNLMTSAFASVSEMSNKSPKIFSLSNNSNETALLDTNNEYISLENKSSSSSYSSTPSNNQISSAQAAENRKSVLLRALSISSPKQYSPDQQSQFETESSKSSNILADSLTNKASNIFNKINPFDLPTTDQKYSNINFSTNSDSLSSYNANQFIEFHRQNILKKLSARKKSLFTSFLIDFDEENHRNLNNQVNRDKTEEKEEFDDNNNDTDDSRLEEMIEQSKSSQNIHEESNNSSNHSSIKKKVKPHGVLEYQVEADETIEKIALKWNTVPSEIKRLNRLSTRVIFPGQVIYVPDPDYVPPPISPPPSPHSKSQLPLKILNEYEQIDAPMNDSSSNNQQHHHHSSGSGSGGFNIFKWKTSSAAKPGHVEKKDKKDKKLTFSLSQGVESSSKQSSEENSKKSPLARRHTITEEEAKQLDEECMQRFIKLNSKIVTRSKGSFDGVLIITPSAVMFDPSDPNAGATCNSEENNAGSNQSSSNRLRTTSIYDEASAIIPIEMISNVIMYEDLTLKDVQEYFDYQHHIDLYESDKESAEIHIDEKEKPKFCLIEENENKNNSVSSSEKIVDNKNNLAEPKNDLESLSKNDSTNLQSSHAELANDENSSSTTLISCYICIKVNKDKDFISCPLDRKMKNRLISEFWFQINDNSTDKICAFFLEWKSESHTSTSDLLPKSRFQLIKPDEKLADLIAENLMANSFFKKINKSFSTTNRLINKDTNFIKDWEIVNLYELEMKLKHELELEKEYKTLPTLMNKSTILKDEHLRKLNVNLIPRAMGYNWVLSFCTEEHGFSLATLYRHLAEIESPCLIVVMDTNRNIFGAMSSSKLYQSEHYYGTGESFLFTFYPAFKVFKWTGENNFFTRGTLEGLGFGCGEGYHGLWFDNDLLYGHTQKSKTYDSEMLTSQEYFTIASIEVWTFSDE